MKLSAALAVLLASAAVVAAFPVEQTALYKFFHEKVDAITKDGRVDVRDLQRFIDQMDPNEEDPTIVPAIEGVTRVHAHYDTDRDGVITWPEFSDRFERLLKLEEYESDAPQEVHLSLTTDPAQMLVSWAQQTYSPAPTVQYGVTPNALTMSAVGASHNYTIDMFEGPWHSMQLSVVLLDALTASTRYYYRCGSDEAGWGNVTSFVSAPAADSVPSQIVWAVYGDMGTVVPFGFEVTDELVAQNAVAPFDMVLHVGDLAYAGVSSKSAGEWEPTWDVWMNQIQPLAEVTPYQVTVGNHEGYYNWAAFDNRFDMPGPQSNGNASFWWSFDYGSVHLTAFSTEDDFSVGSVQYDWIEADLKAARARPNLKWLFVAGHRPFLSSDESEYNTHEPGAPMFTALAPLFATYGVDMVFTGHMHCYERTYPVTAAGTIPSGITPGQNAYTNPGAPVYIVQGNAGAMVLEQWVQPQPAWSANRQQVYGFGRLTLDSFPSNGTDTLHYQSWSDGKVVDEVFITKTA